MQTITEIEAQQIADILNSGGTRLGEIYRASCLRFNRCSTRRCGECPQKAPHGDQMEILRMVNKRGKTFSRPRPSADGFQVSTRIVDNSNRTVLNLVSCDGMLFVSRASNKN